MRVKTTLSAHVEDHRRRLRPILRNDSTLVASRHLHDSTGSRVKCEFLLWSETPS